MSNTGCALSVSTRIAQRVKRLPKGQPFCISRFAELGTRGAIAKAVARLVSRGELERITRGVYMRPKQSKYIGRVRPSPLAVMEVITKANGETIQMHGAEAVRRLGLSTQMQVLPTFYTSGSTREIKVGNAVIRLRKRTSRVVGCVSSYLMPLTKLPDGTVCHCLRTEHPATQTLQLEIPD